MQGKNQKLWEESKQSGITSIFYPKGNADKMRALLKDTIVHFSIQNSSILVVFFIYNTRNLNHTLRHTMH